MPNLGKRPFRALVATAAAGCLVLGGRIRRRGRSADHAGPFAGESIPEGLPQLENPRPRSSSRSPPAPASSSAGACSPRRSPGRPRPARPVRISSSSATASRIATVSDSTNFADAAGTATSTYTVTPVVDGIRGEESGGVSPTANGYVDIPLEEAGRRRHARRARPTRTRPTTRAWPTSTATALRAHREVGSVELEGRVAGRLHRRGLHRHLRVRRHAAQPHLARQEHPGRCSLHAVPRLRLRRRRPQRADAQDGSRHEVDDVLGGRQRGIRELRHPPRARRRRRRDARSRLPDVERRLPRALRPSSSSRGTSGPRSSPGSGRRPSRRRGALR